MLSRVLSELPAAPLCWPAHPAWRHDMLAALLQETQDGSDSSYSCNQLSGSGQIVCLLSTDQSAEVV